MQDGTLLAAVDLGSNSFHLVVARYSHGQLVVIDRLREMVRLGAGVSEDGRIDKEVAARALACGLPAVLDRRVRFEPHPSLPNFAQMSGARSG